MSGNQNQDFPPRLFASGRYPKGRLNVYSKLDILSFVQSTLDKTPKFDIILASPFGGLYNLPVSQCPISCQLIHGLLSRQLVTRKKYEMWTVFGGHPLRFSLAEFGSITGFNYGDIPGYFRQEKKKRDYPIFEVVEGSAWHRYIGSNPKTTLADVADMLENSEGMPSWRKFGLALILIIDGVLIASLQTHRPTPEYVDLLDDEDKFLNFPWGRESFLKTVNAMRPRKPNGRKEDPIKSFRQNCNSNPSASKASR